MTSRYVALTSIRGLAAWWVVLYHFKAYLDPFFPDWIDKAIANGFLAVDLFFVLSGFVIYLNYGDRQMKLGHSDFRVFIVKRFARIYPLHLITLVCYLSIPLSILIFSDSNAIPDRFTLGSYLANFLLVQNWGVMDRLSWNHPAWSISVEWFAYLTFPIAGALTRITRGSHLRQFALTLATLIIIFLFYFLFSLESIGQDIPKFGLFRCVSSFFLGCLCCEIHQSMKKGQLSQNTPAILIAAIVPIYIVANIQDYAVLPLLFMLIVLALANEKGLLTTVMSMTPLHHLGNISYSTYMWHYLVFEWFKLVAVTDDHKASGWSLVLVFLILLVISHYSYKVIEVPARRFLVKQALRSGPRAKTISQL